MCIQMADISGPNSALTWMCSSPAVHVGEIVGRLNRKKVWSVPSPVQISVCFFFFLVALKTLNKMFPDLKQVCEVQTAAHWSICDIFPTYFTELSVYAYQESSLVLLLSCQLHVDSQNFGCSIEFTGSTLLRLPHCVFLLFSTELSA